MEEPRLIKGGVFMDERGTLFFNNEFDVSLVKRIYAISNHDVEFVRGWQGHNIEKRWFMPLFGEFTILVKKVVALSEQTEEQKFILNGSTLDVLYVPNGYHTAIISMQQDSKLMVMSDYYFNEIDDDLREVFIK